MINFTLLDEEQRSWLNRYNQIIRGRVRNIYIILYKKHLLYFIVDPDGFQYGAGFRSIILVQSGYGSGSTKSKNHDPMWIRFHNRNFNDKFKKKFLEYKLKVKNSSSL
jgi:hypothetical protein